MGFKCMNCGGNVLFDVPSQSMKCQHCGSTFKPEQFDVRNQSTGEVIPEMQLTLFTCSSCGAELQGTEESRVGFCPYCGNQSLLQSPNSGKDMPEKLIPFQVSREQCADLFRKHTKKVRYLPKELRDAAYLENFTGIYMPYYEYDVRIGASHITGTKVVENTSRYEVVNTYQVDASAEGSYCGVPFDASKYYDDEIAARALPFDMKKERPFRAAYLSGFYADASTVPAETYYRDAEITASKDVVEEVSERIRQTDGIKVEKETSRVETTTTGHHSTMFPLWFLTWRKDERVAYAVVNGDSGKVVSDLPVDMKAFSLGCVAFAVVLFLILEMLVQPTPLITSMVSLIVGALMAGSIRSSTRSIFEKQTHANDKGWTGTAEPTAKVKGTDRKKKKAGDTLISGSTYIVLILLFVFHMMSDELSTGMVSKTVAVVVVFYLLMTVRKIFEWQKSVPERQPTIAIIPVLAAVVLNAVIVFISPVNDIWYYLGDAVCILILIAASTVMLQVYNIGTTRPLPRLFDREEVH